MMRRAKKPLTSVHRVHIFGLCAAAFQLRQRLRQVESPICTSMKSRRFTMSDAAQAVAAVNKASLEAGLSIAQIAVDATEKLTRLQVEAGKALFEEGVAQARNAAAAKAPTDLFQIRDPLSTVGLDKWVSFSKHVFGIAHSAQVEASQVVEKHVVSVQKDVIGAVEKVLAQSSMPGTDQAVTALKTAITQATAVSDAVKVLLKQSTDFAEAGMKVASQQTEAVKAASKRAH
ncbi:MAG: phasin family protein [Burkholderiales bacterium]|jgi:phasin family protein|nr:phasin family protein [Burkholderiales bacterium]